MALNGKSKLKLSPALKALVDRFVKGEQYPIWLQTPNALLGGKTPETVLVRKGAAK